MAADNFVIALTMVLEGKADVALGMNFDTYLLHQSVLTGIDPIFIDSSYVIGAVTAVRSDWPELVGILNKGLDTLGEGQPQLHRMPLNINSAVSIASTQGYF